ncbi:phage antirepressor KilAC domain-containing protein [Variovorax dokdonensis]|uniref:Phage antirepressor KilAC domain-containing protein n=1 Tax=Variovorax dokdonensis TaxID=344883 RepID=A0ABT7N744_9BURK|nr:phage antirepressor KilAC domain-containing protein [Variovorax dokdonensis]MDM0043752.1 phage antirepressor KilAC domain-containing protein [Variovorax dokdonensis]
MTNGNKIIIAATGKPLGNPTGALLLTMSSREIADLVESRHDSVKLTIERLAAKGVIQLPPMVEVKNHLGQAVGEYSVGKRDSCVIVAQLSPEFTARLVDRWQELEAAATPRVPQTMAQALRLAAEQAEQIERQTAALVAAAPKVEFHDRYAVSTGNRGVREVAKLLGANERQFIEWLTREDGPMYRLAGVLTPKAQHLDAKRFAVKAGTAEHGNGISHAFNQAKFTPKGVQWIAGEWGKRNVLVQIGGSA